MKAMAKLALMCALCVLSGLRFAGAAVTCVENKSTGKFEEKGGAKRPTGECEAQASMNMVSSVAEIEDLSASEGTRVIGGVIVTNASKPFGTVPPAKAKAEVVALRGDENLRDVRDMRKVVPVELHSDAGSVDRLAGAPAPVEKVARFRLEKGQPIHVALEGWAKDAGWTLIWYPAVSWKAISDVDIKNKKDVVEAVSEVITVLRSEGKPVRLRVSDGNNVMEVLSTEVKND